MNPAPFEGADDVVLPFAVEALDVRGRVVRLGTSLDTILARHAYPDAVARVLGEAAALTVLLGSSLKLEGRFQLQTKTDGPISMIVVDFDAPDRMRAYARFEPEQLGALLAGGKPRTGDLLGSGILAMTIDQGSEASRYQGVVALEGGGFEEAAHTYFKQSEQIPTRVRLAVAEEFTGGRHAYRAGGLLVQFLPSSPERLRQADLDPGDIPADHPARDFVPAEDDAWAEARALVDTVEDHELVDPSVGSERLLYRLFHERGVRVFDGQAVHEACRCSQDRIMRMMRNFGADDRAHMVGDNGRVVVTCEFCSRVYDLDPAEIEREIAAPDPELADAAGHAPR